MGTYDKYFYTKAEGILGPVLHPEIDLPTIKVDHGKLGEFGISWEPITHPFKMMTTSHRHDYAQILGFVGNDLNNMFDFDAEIELYLEGEKYTINKTTVVYIPGGMLHCPIEITRVGKPFLFNNMFFTAVYMSKKEDKPFIK